MLDELLALGFKKQYTVNNIVIYMLGNWQVGIRNGKLYEVYLGTRFQPRLNEPEKLIDYLKAIKWIKEEYNNS